MSSNILRNILLHLVWFCRKAYHIVLKMLAQWYVVPKLPRMQQKRRTKQIVARKEYGMSCNGLGWGFNQSFMRAGMHYV